MCGRYVRRSDKQRLAEHFHANPVPAELPLPPADYNVAPTTYQPLVRQSKVDGSRKLILARWGRAPLFSKSLSDVKGLSTINARSETITKAPTWREPFKKRRYIIPANAFYEWVRPASRPDDCPAWSRDRTCFDNISHDWLLAHVPMDRVILRKWLKAGYMEKQVLHATEQGTPQGGIILPVLADVALDSLEQRLRQKYPMRGKGSEKGRRAGAHLIR